MKLKLLVMTGALAGLAYAGMTVSDLLGGSDAPAGAKLAAAASVDDTPASLTITANDDAGAQALAAGHDGKPSASGEPTDTDSTSASADGAAAGQPGPSPDTAATAASVDEPGASAVVAPARGGLLGVLTAIEQHGQRSGVVCEHIEVPELAGAPYELAGHGEPAAVVDFLAALELDPTLGGAVHLRVWSEGERRLCFQASWAVPAPLLGGR